MKTCVAFPTDLHSPGLRTRWCYPFHRRQSSVDMLSRVHSNCVWTRPISVSPRRSATFAPEPVVLDVHPDHERQGCQHHPKHLYRNRPHGGVLAEKHVESSIKDRLHGPVLRTKYRLHQAQRRLTLQELRPLGANLPSEVPPAKVNRNPKHHGHDRPP